jgi:tetratricopeptide (TPR) repeat protein
MSLVRLGRREEGVPYLRESLAMRLKMLGDSHPDVQLVRVNLGRALQDERKYAAAESLLTDALRARRAMFGDANGAVASSTDDLAGLAFARGDYPAAIRQYRAAIEIWRAGKLPQWELLSQSSLGEALMRADSLDEAERVLRDAVTKQRAAYGPANADVIRTAQRLADLLLRRGGDRLAESDSLFRGLLAARRTLYGATSTQLNSTLAGLAHVREAMGDTAGAEPFIREIVTNTAAVRPPNDSTLLARKVWLGQTLCATGRAPEGLRVVR